MLYYNYKQKRFGFYKTKVPKIPISSTGYSTVHRTDGIHSFGGNPDSEYYAQNTTNLSTLQLEYNDARQLTDYWRDVNALGRSWERSVRVNAIALGLSAVSGERIGALTWTRLIWACKPRYKTGVSHVELHYPLNFKIYVINFLILAHSVWQCVRFLLTKKQV